MERSSDLITRREALRRAAYMLGGALSAPTVAGVLAGCEASPRSGGHGAGVENWAPQTLSTEQDELVLALGEHILPETDTPGARAARVDTFIDAMLTDYYPAEQRQRFLAGLDRVDAHARRAFGKRFLELAPKPQLRLVEALNRATFHGRERPEADAVMRQDGEVDRRQLLGAAPPDGDWPDGDWPPEDVGRDSFFGTLKELVVVGYYSSEVGATEELTPNPMGSWRADIPYAEVGQAWAY